ncbi:MAG: flagellar assembly protein FliX [Rhodospirillaceae bacterium]|nr:flagellar assembly protein FliX [Rhodospirillaceae bacterium]
MVKIEGSKGPAQVQPGKARRAERGGPAGAFASELSRANGPGEPEPAEVGAVDSSSAVAGVGSVLAAQTVGTDDRPTFEERQRRAKRGAEILDRLEEIRRGLLLGIVPKDRLADLARLVREKRERGADPVVARLLDEIELRAEVELAKLSRR